MNKTSYTILIIILALFASAIQTPVLAQKKKGKATSKVAAKPAEPQEDMTQWIENPVCKIMVIDSIVVSSDAILQHLPLPHHLGKISQDISTKQVVHENEFGDQRIFAANDTSGHSRIFMQALLGEKWSEPEQVTINGSFIDITNPFPMPDGQTLYFAATSEEDNEGKCFSIYTTTYDAETNSYLTPQRLPYPFTSTDDDVYYIEDEADSLSWFVTTRRQPEGMACIYTIRAKTPWVFYDSDNTDASKLKRLALMNRIADTWPSAKERNLAYAEAQELLGRIMADKAGTPSDINFIINDNKKYSSLYDFRSTDGEALYLELQKEIEKVASTKRQLEEYRRMYHNASAENKARLSSVILESEETLKKSSETVKSLSKKIRKNEQQDFIDMHYDD